MLPQAPTCRRALQRQLYTSSDSVWVSDEALSHVYQRFFAVSKTRKRYGSFVPGPLESRRRLGKRRMTLQSDAVPTPAHGIAALWSSFGEADRMRWRWEAPSSRESRIEEAVHTLPKWLVEWGTTPPDVLAEPVTTTEPAQKSKFKKMAFRGEVRSFRKALEVANPEDMPTLCDEFNQRLKQTLVLGLHAEETISYVFKLVPESIRQAFVDSNDANQHCISLCQAMWEGISTCRVMQPSDFSSSILATFVTTLSELSMCQEVHVLANKILSSVTADQLHNMRRSIFLLVKSWVESWVHEETMISCDSSLLLAVQAVSNAESTVIDTRRLVRAMENRQPSKKNLETFQEALQTARSSIYKGAEAILEAEMLASPKRRSIKALATVLGHIPLGTLMKITKPCFIHILRTYPGVDMSSITIRRCWLSLIVGIPNVTEDLILKTWSNPLVYREVGQDAGSIIMLDHWTSQDLFVRPALNRIFFDVAASQFGRRDYSILLLAIEESKDKCWTRSRSLLRFLARLGQDRMVYKTLSRMNNMGMKIPADLLDETLENMATRNPVLALRTFRLCHSMRANQKPLRLELCPNFIFSMIDNPDVPSATIWESLGIPIYESLPHSSRAKHAFTDKKRSSPLTPIMVEHISKMATLFAHSETRPQRVAFRNIMQCLFHLRRHHVPVTPELTRAITHAGITRKIMSEGWIAKERVEWILSMIEMAEGTEVATTIDKIVLAWNQHVSDKVSERDSKVYRESNPLGVGPID